MRGFGVVLKDERYRMVWGQEGLSSFAALPAWELSSVHDQPFRCRENILTRITRFFDESTQIPYVSLLRNVIAVVPPPVCFPTIQGRSPALSLLRFGLPVFHVFQASEISFC